MRNQPRTPRPGRLKRFLRRLGWVFGIVVAVYVIAGLTFRLLIWAELKRIERAGDPVSLAQLYDYKVPDSKNGALIYEKVFRIIEGRPGFPKIWRVTDQLELKKNPKIWEDAHAEIPRFRRVVELSSQAASMPECKLEVNWEAGYFPRTADMHDLLEHLRDYAILLAHYRRNNEALRVLELSTRVADSTKHDDALLIPLIDRAGAYSRSGRIAADMAAKTNLDPDRAKSLCDALDYLPLKCQIPVMWKWDRASVLHYIDRAARLGPEKPPVEDYVPNPIMQFECSFAGRPVLWADEYFQLHAMRGVIANSRLPFRKLHKPDQSRAECPWHQKCPAASPLPFCQEMWVDLDIYGWRRWFDSDEAGIDAGRICLALRIYKQRYGSFPERLTDLNKLGWKLDLIDPFTGREFAYKRVGSGFLVYSIGPDLKDQHGTPLVDGQWDRGGDIVWKMKS